jgi:hypothetical protein
MQKYRDGQPPREAGAVRLAGLRSNGRPRGVAHGWLDPSFSVDERIMQRAD